MSAVLSNDTFRGMTKVRFVNVEHTPLRTRSIDPDLVKASLVFSEHRRALSPGRSSESPREGNMKQC